MTALSPSSEGPPAAIRECSHAIFLMNGSPSVACDKAVPNAPQFCAATRSSSWASGGRVFTRDGLWLCARLGLMKQIRPNATRDAKRETLPYFALNTLYSPTEVEHELSSPTRARHCMTMDEILRTLLRNSTSQSSTLLAPPHACQKGSSPRAYPPHLRWRTCRRNLLRSRDSSTERNRFLL